MKYIGNYSEWIKKEWIDYLLSSQGEKHPRIDPNEYGKGNKLDKLRQYGYKLEDTFWYSFESRSFPFEFEPPFDLGKNYDWWFVKMLCGNFIPFHRDHPPGKYENMTVRRFWMPLQDYTEGHIFIMEDEFLKNYRAGDVFEYELDGGRHGAFNISMGIPRLTLNFQGYYV